MQKGLKPSSRCFFSKISSSTLHFVWITDSVTSAMHGPVLGIRIFRGLAYPVMVALTLVLLPSKKPISPQPLE